MAAHFKQWMIYGAYGYTGRLIAQRAVADGHQPVLAGRDEVRLQAIAQELDCPYRVFSLKDPQAATRNLAGVSALLNCAGPFSETAEQMIETCLLAGVHYLDITGEWKVIEYAAQQDARAKAAGIVILPATGFDVVPSDCLAKQLATALPTARSLTLAFQVTARESSISPGTATTIFSQLGQGTFARIAGRIAPLPASVESTSIPFPSGEKSAMSISWGDIASAFYSTGIPNIRVYQALSPQQIHRMKRWSWLLPLAGWKPIQWLGRCWIKRNLPGPSDAMRDRGRAEFWGRVIDEQGRSAEATLTTPEGYNLTAHTSVEIVRRVLAGDVPPGFTTPAKAFGGNFIEHFAGVKISWITQPA